MGQQIQGNEISANKGEASSSTLSKAIPSGAASLIGGALTLLLNHYFPESNEVDKTLRLGLMSMIPATTLGLAWALSKISWFAASGMKKKLQLKAIDEGIAVLDEELSSATLSTDTKSEYESKKKRLTMLKVELLVGAVSISPSDKD